MMIKHKLLSQIKFLSLVTLTLSLSLCKQPANKYPALTGEVTDTLSAADSLPPRLMFGIPADSFDLISGHFKPNRFLSDVLMAHGISMQEIDQLIKNSSGVFDVRKIRAGNDYTLFCEPDSAGRARYLVYEHDPTTCYIFSLKDSLNITLLKKSIKKEIRYSSGTIQSSLWESMMQDSLHPTLAVDLSDIFAWTVDFFDLQKGDSFKVIYDEQIIDGRSLGVDRIYGALFTWSGKTTVAIPFIQNGEESFFDAEGNSLRKAFLKAPLKFSRISSRFSYNRMHPILKIRRPHLGVDYAAPVGTPVHSVGDGKVIMAEIQNGSGRIVKIVHNSEYTTAYMHLSRFGRGAFVKQGDIIGYVGSSGLSTGPHLDFRFYKNGTPVDPLRVESPPVEPVSEENMQRFEEDKKVVMTLLSTF